MDIVYIKGLKIETLIGIYAWERQVKQVLIFDIEMATDIRPAATSDDIQHTLNYKAVAKRLFEFVGDSEFLLVETLAEKVAALIQDEFNVPWLRLRLNKQGALRGSDDVGVIIERGEKL